MQTENKVSETNTGTEENKDQHAVQNSDNNHNLLSMRPFRAQADQTQPTALTQSIQPTRASFASSIRLESKASLLRAYNPATKDNHHEICEDIYCSDLQGDWHKPKLPEQVLAAFKKFYASTKESLVNEEQKSLPGILYNTLTLPEASDVEEVFQAVVDEASKTSFAPARDNLEITAGERDILATVETYFQMMCFPNQPYDLYKGSSSYNMGTNKADSSKPKLVPMQHWDFFFYVVDNLSLLLKSLQTCPAGTQIRLKSCERPAVYDKEKRGTNVDVHATSLVALLNYIVCCAVHPANNQHCLRMLSLLVNDGTFSPFKKTIRLD